MKKLLFKIKAFYIKDLLFIKDLKSKTFEIAVALALLENVQMLSVYTNDLNTIQYDEFPNQVQSWINNFKIYSLFGNSITARIVCVMVGFSIQTIFLLSVFYFVLRQDLFLKQKLILNDLPLTQNKQNYHFEKCWKSTFISCYMQINLEVLQTPLLFCAVSLITDILGLKSLNEFEYIGLFLSLILIILQIIVGAFLHFHQTDYRIKNYDFLGKVQSLENHITFTSRIFIILLSGSQYNSIINRSLGLLISCVQAIYTYRKKTYIDYKMINIVFKINSLMVIYQMIFILCEFGYPTIKVSASLLILLFYPLILFLIHSLHIRQEQKNDYKNQIYFIRRLYQNAKNQVQSRKRQQHQDQQQIFQIFTVVRSHLENCKQMRIRKMLKCSSFKLQCFCSTFAKQKDSLQNIHQCKEFLKLLLGQVLEDDLKEDSSIQKTLTYIGYLIEIKKAPISAIYEVIRLSTLKKLPLRFQQIIHQLQQNSLEKYNKLVKKQNLVNQMFDFKKAYLFEESLKILKQNLFLIVKQEIEFYECFFTPIINAQILQEKGMLLVTNINHLENQIQLTFRTNPQNGECDTIYKLFQKYINYNKIRPKLFRREGQLMADFIQSLDKLIYDQKSCVVQITLLQPRGNVIKYTRSFQQVVQCKDDEIIDQNIKKYIPSIIANDHDLYLNNFVETGRINVLKRELRIILVKLKSQFVIPMNTRLRIEVNPYEFGAQALMTPVNHSYGYLMLNEQGQIEEITKNLYEDIFKQYLGLEFELVRGLDFLLMIPELSKIWLSLFDENFEKLDLYMEGYLMIPVIEKQVVSPIFSMNYGKKLLFNKKLQEYMTIYPQNLIKYQINFHLTSLTTINLRVVIVEIPEYKQAINKQQVSQVELIQFQPPKTNMNIAYQSEIPTNKSYGIHSHLNTPPLTKTLMNECDLEYDNLIEEKKMIEEFRNQLALVSMNNTIQNNSKELLIQQQQQQCENVSDTKIIIPQNVISYRSDEFEQKQFQQEQFFQQQQQNGSVGSKSSQNNSNTFKLQIKDCLYNNKGLNFKIKIFLLIFYSLLLIGYILNFCILFYNFHRFDSNLEYENLPYQFTYYYNEFVIANVYRQQKQEQFQFDDLCEISINYYQQHQQYIDKVVTYIPQINYNKTQQTMLRKTNNILSQMIEIYYNNQSIFISDFLNNSYAFHDLLEKVEQSSSPSKISSLLIYFVLEEIVLFLLLSGYAYFYIQILRMKIVFYKLFCTLSKDFMKDQFIQFYSLYNQINHTKFKCNETNEESFEASMVSQFHKNSTQRNLENQVKIGKQISTPQISLNLIFFLIMMLMLTAFSSSYYFGTFLLQNQVLDRIEANYVRRTYYENTANHLTFAYAHQAVFYNQTITQEMIQYQNEVAEELKSLITKITLSQEQSNSRINKILLDEVCTVFQEEILLQDRNYQNLFSFEHCQSVPSLQKGLLYVSQELFSIYYDNVQNFNSINQNETSKFSYQLQTNIQKERLYSQFSFQLIIEILQSEVKKLIKQTIDLNILMFILANILASMTLFIAKVLIENAQSQYSDHKKILILFPFDRLMENAYVHSFITQDLRYQD